MSTTLTPQQLAGLAEQQGLSPQQATVAVAIAEAESGGQLGAVGRNSGVYASQQDLGLWQIGYDASRGLHTTYDPARLTQDAAYNARAMAALSNGGTNWNAWSSYTSGAYKKYLPEARTGVKSPTPFGAVATSAPKWVWIAAAIILLLVVVRR